MSGRDILTSLNLTPHQLLYSGDKVSVYSGAYYDYQVVFKVLELPYGIDQQMLEGECQKMRSAQHENVVQLYNYCWTRTPQGAFLVFVLEACDKDLAKDMKHRKDQAFPYSENELWNVMVTLVRAFAYMQRLELAHRDIKPDNIFLSRGTLKIGDFGSARYSQASQITATLIGTPIYLSPLLRQAFLEHQQKVVHNVFKSDVYSLGLTLLALATLEAPIFAQHGGERQVLDSVYALQYSDGIKRLMLWMLKWDEADRPDFVQMDEWITATYYSQPAIPQIEPQTISPNTVGSKVSNASTQSSLINPSKPKSPPHQAEPSGMKKSSLEEGKHESEPLVPPETRNPHCLSCGTELQLGSSSTIVQLKCRPDYHVFCGVNCFSAEVARQRGSGSPLSCPQCHADIDQADLDAYCVREGPGCIMRALRFALSCLSMCCALICRRRKAKKE